MTFALRRSWGVPAAIVLFFLMQAVLRLLILPGSLDIDEAQFVGQSAFSADYGNAHPPLYSWLVSLAVSASGGRWDWAAAGLRATLLALAFILAWDCGTRIIDSSRGGLLSISFLALVPEISFQSQHTLAHSILLTVAVVATLNGACRWWQSESSGYPMLGVAIVVGTLAKYNYLLFLAAFCLAAFSIRSVRRRLRDRTLVVTLLLTALLLLPFALWVSFHLEEATGRIYKLYQQQDGLAAMDIPGLGVDGLLSLVARIGAWMLPVVLVVGLSARPPIIDCASTPRRTSYSAFVNWLLRTAMIGLAVMVLVVLLADVHRVHTRYLTPILLPLPFAAAALVARYPRPWGRQAVLASGLTVALLMSIAINVRYLTSPISMALPFDALVTTLRARFPQGVTLVDWHLELAGNVASRWDAARIGHWQGLEAAPVILLAEEPDHAEQLLKQWSERGLAPAGPFHRISASWANHASGTPYLVWRCLTIRGSSGPAACDE